MRKRIKDSLHEMTEEFQPECYTNARKIEFLLNNAIDAADYAQAMEEAEKIRLSSEEKTRGKSDR